MPLLAALLFSPGFAIAGLCLAAVPIIIHLLNRRRYKVVNWAAMEFLLRAMRKNRRRVRFEQWLLLATRCCLLALLGLALARPIGCDRSGSSALAGRTGVHVFVIDTGLSMGYQPGRAGGLSHLEQAKRVATGIIDRLTRGGESVVVITAGRPARGVIPKPTYDLDDAKAQINRIEQQYGATDMADALRMAIEVGHDQERQPNKRLYLLTDATASEWQTFDSGAIKTQGTELSRLFEVEHFNLSTGPQWNQAVTDLRPAETLVTNKPDFGSAFVADVRGYGRPQPSSLQWKVDNKVLGGGGKITPDTDSKPQTEPETESQPALVSPGPHLVSATLLGDDKVQADNTRNRVVNVVAGLKALIVEGEHGVGAEGGSGLNLQVALAGNGKSGASDGFVVPELISDIELGNKALGDYRAVMMCSVSTLTTAQADQLARFVRDGGTLMWFLSENTQADNYNTVLLKRGLLPGKLIKPIVATADRGFHFDFHPGGTIHPLLKLFDQPNTGLETALTYGYWQMDAPADPQVRVLNWLPPDGTPVDKTVKPDPAVTVTSLGSGKIVTFTTSADERWVTYTRKQIYTELLNELVAGTVNSGDAWMNLTVGEELHVPASYRLTTIPSLTDPKKASTGLKQVPQPDGSTVWQSDPLNQPGVYTLTTGTNTTVPIAVNVPPGASDVHTLDNAAIKAALGGIDVTLSDDQPPAVVDPTSAGSDQGWNVMALVLILAGFEAFLAMRFGHYKKPTGTPAVA